MQINGLAAYLLLEALFIVALLALGLLWLYLREKRRARHQSETTDSPPADDVYQAALAQRIHDTEAQLEQLGDDTNTATAETLTTRLHYLRAERSSHGTGDAFWSQLGEALQPLLEAIRLQAETPEECQNRLIKALRTRVQAYEIRVANLEQFKLNFFELKERYTETVQHNRDLHSAVEQAVPDAQQSPELKDALQRMEQENHQLQQQLAQLEQEFDSIMRNVRTSSGSVAEPGQEPALDSGSADKVEQGVQQIRQVIDNQAQQIRELHSIIAGLELELNDKQALQLAIENITSRNEQLSGVVEILEEENNFMQQQISALLAQGMDESKQHQKRAEDAESHLVRQKQMYAELEKECAILEGKLHAATDQVEQLKIPPDH